jgi:uncharacterized protein (TIGR00255 family)
MRSMTGYGRGVGAHGDVRATVDVRAVNHRFLDLKLRGSALPPALEEAIGSRVRGALERGAVVVSVNLARGGAAAALAIDGAAAERVHRQLADLAARLGMPGPDLALVLAQPGVVVAGEPAASDDDAATTAAHAAIDAALSQLAEMRRAEGDALAKDLLARLAELDAARQTIAGLAASLPAQIARRLGERIHRLAAEVAIDDARIAQEVALHADRADVTEELIRLASHLEQARALIAGPGAVGRRLDFLVQELGRELNTIGSKSASAEISTAIVGAKATLEKIREQVQNVE